MIKVIRRVTIPDVEVTLGSRFEVYQNWKTQMWRLYDHGVCLAEYTTKREATTAKRELQERRQDLILNMQPRTETEVELR